MAWRWVSELVDREGWQAFLVDGLARAEVGTGVHSEQLPPGYDEYALDRVAQDDTTAGIILQPLVCGSEAAVAGVARVALADALVATGTSSMLVWQLHGIIVPGRMPSDASGSTLNTPYVCVRDSSGGLTAQIHVAGRARRKETTTTMVPYVAAAPALPRKVLRW